MQSEIDGHACLKLVRAQNLENLMSVFDTNPCDMGHVLSHVRVHPALAISRPSQFETLNLCSFSFSVFLFWIQTLKFWTIKQILGKLYDLWENPCFRILSINLIFNKVIWPITLLNYQKSSVQYWRRTVLFTEDSHFLRSSPLYSPYHIVFMV